MSRPSLLHAQLVDQARHLARKEPRRPLPSSLQRSVSATYFALFHFLVRESTRALLGTSKRREAMRNLLASAHDPEVMAATCRTFAAGELGGGLARCAGAEIVPDELREVARAFLVLQHQRRRADYDPAARFEREEVEALAELAERAMRTWRKARPQPAARIFLLCLLAGDRLTDV